jgi:hypothetical protein
MANIIKGDAASTLLKISPMTYRDEQIDIETKRVLRYEPSSPGIINWVMKYSGGLIKDEKQAVSVVLCFVAITLLITFVVFFSAIVPGDIEKRIPLR